MVDETTFYQRNSSYETYKTLYGVVPPALLSVFGSIMTNSGRSLLMRLPLRIGTSPPKYSR